MQLAVLNFPLEHARFDLRTQNPMPPSAGPGNPCMAPQSAPGGARSNAQQRRFRPQAPDRFSISGIHSNPESEAANVHPPLLGRGRSCGSFAARLGIRVPRPPRSETKLFRPSFLRVRDPAAAPDWLLGASPLPCRGRNRGARLLCAQWWARSCDRSDAGRLARLMGRNDGVLRGAREWTPTVIGLHDGACGPFIWPSR